MYEKINKICVLFGFHVATLDYVALNSPSGSVQCCVHIL